jgi:putative inorganic carbon (hco3(-)) transporter
MSKPAMERGNALDRAAEMVADYGVAAIVLTLPLEFTAKFLHQQLSRFVIGVVLLAFVYLLARRTRPLLVPKFASVWLLLAVVAVSLASWLLTRAPGATATNSLLDIALYPLVGLLIANLVLTREDHRRAWTAFLASAAGVAILGAILYLVHAQIWAPNPLVAHRLNITFADPNITARFLTLGACAAVLVFAAGEAPVWLTGAAALACGVVLPLTYSRSGLALFVLMVALMVPLAFDRRRAAAIAAVTLIAFGLSTGLNPDTRQRATDAAGTVAGFVTGSHHSTSPSIEGGVALEDNRVFLVAAGLKMFTDHPVTGVGFGGYQHALLTTYRQFLPQGYTDSVSHTSVVTVLAEQGVIGALLLMLFFLQLAREAWSARSRRDEWSTWTTVAAAMVVPIFLYSQFEGRLLQEPYLWLVLGLFYGAQQVALRRHVTLPAASAAPTRRSVEAA